MKHLQKRKRSLPRGVINAVQKDGLEENHVTALHEFQGGEVEFFTVCFI